MIDFIKNKIKDGYNYAKELVYTGLDLIEEVVDVLPGDNLKRKELKDTKKKFENISNAYNKSIKERSDKMTILKDSRWQYGEYIFETLENYKSTLDKLPEEVLKKLYITHYKLKIELNFLKKINVDNSNLSELEEEFDGISIKKNLYCSLAGVGIATLGPVSVTGTVATVGTAKTGVAISSLSGGAKTNAILAWIGFGSKAVGICILTSIKILGLFIAFPYTIKILYSHYENNQDEISRISQNIEHLKKDNKIIVQNIENITGIIEQTEDIYYKFLKSEAFIDKHAPKNYSEFNKYHKKELDNLIENVNSFSELLGHNTNIYTLHMEMLVLYSVKTP